MVIYLRFPASYSCWIAVEILYLDGFGMGGVMGQGKERSGFM